MIDAARKVLVSQAWPAARADGLFEDELETLAAMLDEHGQVKATAPQKFAKFRQDYFDRRKAAVDPESEV